MAIVLLVFSDPTLTVPSLYSEGYSYSCKTFIMWFLGTNIYRRKKEVSLSRGSIWAFLHTSLTRALANSSGEKLAYDICLEQTWTVQVFNQHSQLVEVSCPWKVESMCENGYVVLKQSLEVWERYNSNVLLFPNATYPSWVIRGNYLLYFFKKFG
jgi:hypothetical protein